MAGNDNQDSGTNPGHSKELRRKKRIRYFLYFLAFAIFQVAGITISVLIIMKLRTPKFIVNSATFEFLNTTAAPSFEWKMFAELEVKNTNFGKYEYEDTAVEFLYGGARIGEVGIPESGVWLRSSDKVNVEVNLSSANVAAGSGSELGADLRIGLLRISSSAEMKGKVKLAFVFSRKKSVQMNCDMGVSISTQQLVNISCK